MYDVPAYYNVSINFLYAHNEKRDALFINGERDHWYEGMAIADEEFC